MLPFTLLVFATQALPSRTTQLANTQAKPGPINQLPNTHAKPGSTPVTNFRVPAEYEPVNTVTLSWRGHYHMLLNLVRAAQRGNALQQ